MLNMIPAPFRPYATIALVVAILGAGAWIDHRGYVRGYAASDARQAKELAALQRDLDAANAKTAEVSAQIEAYREAQRMIAQGIEDEARADPAAATRVPTSDSVLRLKRRWQAAD